MSATRLTSLSQHIIQAPTVCQALCGQSTQPQIDLVLGITSHSYLVLWGTQRQETSHQEGKEAGRHRPHQ